MIDQDKRKAILLLFEEGKSKREITRLFQVSRNTVSSIIDAKGQMPQSKRSDKISFDEERLRQLYHDCDGRVQRVHEILTEEDHIEVGYSTLSRKLRRMGLGRTEKKRSDQEPDIPGAEMQHDTSPYCLKIGSKKIDVIASLLYFRYSKVRFLRFYRNFDRFRMQCFFHEALSYFGYAAPSCIIDNTNLARLRGTGSKAVICPEMETFSKKYGFEYICHEVNHANRKAGNERGFYTVETNFFPGRRFSSMEELNQKAFEWATVRLYHRPVGKARLIPAKAFEYERSFLKKLPPYLEAPYRDHERTVDQYGYVAFAGNYYWVPKTNERKLTLLEYDRSLKVFCNKRLLLEYELPADRVRNQAFFPEGYKKPNRQPKNRKRPTEREEKILRSLSEEVNDWLSRILKEKGVNRHPFIRKIYGLHLKLAPALFIQTIKRADHYRITDALTIEQIAELLIKQSGYELPVVNVDSEFINRTAYLDGRSSDPVDLSGYDQLLEDTHDE